MEHQKGPANGRFFLCQRVGDDVDPRQMRGEEFEGCSGRLARARVPQRRLPTTGRLSALVAFLTLERLDPKARRPD
jgi:hypothetical protein